jgi:MFS family permease
MKRVTKILLIASSLWYFGEGLFGPLFAVFSEKIGGDMLEITWAWAAYLIATGLFYVILGKLFNNSSYKKEIMVGGYALNTILTFCYLFVHNTEQLLLLQIGLGIAEAVSTPIWDSLFATHLEDNENSFHWSLANGHTHFVTGIAVAIGGLIANYVSFNALFITMGCIQLLATIIQASLLKEKRY